MTNGVGAHCTYMSRIGHEDEEIEKEEIEDIVKSVLREWRKHHSVDHKQPVE